MGITFSITFVFTLIMGIVVGSYSTHYIIAKKDNQQKPPTEANEHQLYEKVTQGNTSTERFKMGENIAYGPVNKKQ